MGGRVYAAKARSVRSDPRACAPGGAHPLVGLFTSAPSRGQSARANIFLL